MPTLPVRPDDGELLQAIANALVKAKKVVVVTGAGISTNSGIPDFRSEHGLYHMIQEQYEAVARGSIFQDPGPKPNNGNNLDEALNEEDFPEDRPKKRQRLSDMDKEESRLLPEIAVDHGGACAEEEQDKADGGAAEEVDGETICADSVALDTSVPKGLLDNAPSQAKLKGNSHRSRASSLPPARRRSTRLNPGAQDSMGPPEPPHKQACPASPLGPQEHRPAQPAGPVPSTPTPTRRQTITTIQPGGSSPLSDAPTQFSSPSRLFDHSSFLLTSPLSDLPSQLGNSSPVFDRREFRPAAFPSSSSLLSDAPSQLASSPFLNRLALPGNSSPLSDPPAYMPSSPPSINRPRHLISLKSSPLSSPLPYPIRPYELRSRRSASWQGSPSPETREAPLNPQDPGASIPSSTGHEDRAAPEAEEIHCAPNPPARLEPSSQQPSAELTQSREAEEPPSSQPVSSQGSTSARLPFTNIKGRELFDATIWNCPVRTAVFYTFATTLRQKVRNVTPTSSHLFIGHLRDRGKLVRCYTQNIDRIEEKVGLSTSLDRGPGHRSRFSKRAPALSRVNSGVPDAAAADAGESASSSSSGSGGDSEPNSSHATDSSNPPHGQVEPAHKGRDDGGPGHLPEGRPDSELLGASDGTAADGTRSRGPDAPSGDADYPSGPGSSQGNPGKARRPGAAGGGPQQRSTPAHPADHIPASQRDGPEETHDGSAGATPGATGQRQQPGQPALETTDGPAASQESSQGSEAGPAATKPKAPQRESSPSSGVECVFLHGSLECLRCFRCRRVCEWEGLEEQTFSGQQPECPHCAGATAAREEQGKRALGVGKLRPDIVLYGEEHPNAHLISPVVTHDLGLGPDLLLILGTSLKVHGLKVLVRQFAKAVHSRGGKVVFVNFTKPPESSWGDIIDYWVAWDCDAWVGDLKEKVPALWLPPVEEPKKRKSINTKGAERKSVEKKPVEKKSAAPKRKSVAGGKKDGSMKDDKPGVVMDQSTAIEVAAEATPGDASVYTSQEAPPSIVTTHSSAELPIHQQSQTDLSQVGLGGAQPKQQRRPPPLPEDKTNAAYFSGRIMDTLRRISGRSAPPPVELPSIAAARAIAVAEANQAKREAKRKRKRRSTMAAGPAKEEASEPPVEPRMPEPEVFSIHSSTPASRKMEMPPLRPQPGTTPNRMIYYPEQNPGATCITKRKSARIPGPKPNQGPLPNMSIPAKLDPRKPKLKCHQPPATPEQRPPPPPAAPQPSISAAVKSNPRKRKRKTMYGEEEVSSSVGSRRPSPSSDKENSGVRGIPALLAQPMNGMKLAPLTGAAADGRSKPEPVEPESSPEGPASRVEWGRQRAKVAFYYQDVLEGVGGAWRR